MNKIEQLRKEIEDIPDTAPEIENDDYDMGMQTMKEKVLAIISEYE